MLRILRVVRSVRVMAQLIISKRGESAGLAALLLTVLLVVFSSIAVLQFEVPEGDVHSVETDTVQIPSDRDFRERIDPRCRAERDIAVRDDFDPWQRRHLCFARITTRRHWWQRLTGLQRQHIGTPKSKRT